MVSRYIYLQLVFRIVMLSVTALGLAFFFFDQLYVWAGLLLFLMILQAVFLINYVNQTNRKIAYFFDAIKNEDFTLRFPEKLSVKSLEELNHSLNTLNDMIQEIHIKKQTQERYYQEIMKQADIGILTFNQKGHIIYSNPTVERLLQYRPLNHIKQLSQVDEKLYALFEGLKPFDRKLFQLTNEREKRQLALKATAIQLNGEDFLLVVVQDIHQELDEKETDSWVRLIRVLTHEIMNTIAPITSISESILKYFKTDKGLVGKEGFSEEPYPEYGKRVGSDPRARERPGEFCAFLPHPAQRSRTRSQSGPRQEAFGAGKGIDRPQQGRSGQLKIDWISDPENLELFIDEKQITQVLVNLGKNAIQSLKENEAGHIKIKAGLNKSGKKYIEVWDNGPGIPT